MLPLADLLERRQDLQEQIIHRKKNIFLLLDYAIGYKKLNNGKALNEPINDFRLINTIKNIYAQRREELRELSLLNKVIVEKQGKTRNEKIK